MVEAIRNFFLIQLNRQRWVKRTFGYNPAGVGYVKYLGRRFYLFLGDVYGPSYHLMRWGVESYEPENQKVLSRILKDGGVFLDVGANVGIFSVIAADLNPKVKVYAFDPDQKSRECLALSVQSNQLTNVQILPYAMSSDEGSATFYLDSFNHGGSSLNVESISLTPAKDIRHMNVQMTSLDKFIAENDLRSVDLIKVDVQEHEYEVLDGGRASFRELRPIVMVECYIGHLDGERDLFQFFENLDYLVLEPQSGVISSLADMKHQLKDHLAKNSKYYFDLFFVPREKQELVKS